MREEIKEILDKISHEQIERAINKVTEERVPRVIEKKGIWFLKKRKNVEIKLSKICSPTNWVFLEVYIFVQV